MEERVENSVHVQLARRSLESYVRTGTPIQAPDPLPPEFNECAGVFVSLKISGNLRGCIGTLSATAANLAEEIIRNAIRAGTQDPRFSPVRKDELEKLTYSVDVLGPFEPIMGMEDLDVVRYGVVVESGRRSGLLLPNLEGVKTVEEQLAIARQKAGIGPNEPITINRFEVVRFY